MKKKMYISPVAQILEMNTQRLIASSLKDRGDEGLDIKIADDDEEGDADEGCSRQFNYYFQVLLLLVMMAAGLSMKAQNTTTVSPAGPPDDGKMHSMTIYLSNGTSVDYELNELDHVTYLPGIGMKVYLKNASMSVDYLFSQMDKIEYEADNNLNANWNVVENMWTDYPEAWRQKNPPLKDGGLVPYVFTTE